MTHAAGLVAGTVLTIAHDATIDSTSKIDASIKGYGSGTGSGKGVTGVVNGGGGGYGGIGGKGSDGTAGGPTYGSMSEPVDLGSGGGPNNYAWENYPGGAGGGAIRLTVAGTLTLNGRASADGGNGQGAHGYGGGGGSGGSLYPVLMSNKALGGVNTSDYDSVTGAGQRGVADGVGLNNIGLLVRYLG